MTTWLDEADVVEHLVRRGVLADGARASVTTLAGGVSCDVVAVAAPGARLVVKRALPRLRVEEEWLADSARVLTEGRALRLAAELTPDAVPRVLDLDEEACVLTVEHAPTGWANWREELLAGRVDPAVGARLGELLRVWHDAAPATLANVPSFIQLRVNPFYWTVAERHRDLAGRIHDVAERLLTARTSFVHGDFSPKNVLVGESGSWVIDWEVAHAGEPAFDVAYLLAHLLLKSVHRPGDAERYRAVARAFLEAYGVERRATADNLACLLLARVDGKSPAAYLSEAERAVVRMLGRSLLAEPPRDVLDAWCRAA
jgi:5-methylthioribose kinase